MDVCLSAPVVFVFVEVLFVLSYLRRSRTCAAKPWKLPAPGRRASTGACRALAWAPKCPESLRRRLPGLSSQRLLAQARLTRGRPGDARHGSVDTDGNPPTARYEAGNGGLPETRQVCQSHAGYPLQGSIFSMLLARGVCGLLTFMSECLELPMSFCSFAQLLLLGRVLLPFLPRHVELSPWLQSRNLQPSETDTEALL